MSIGPKRMSLLERIEQLTAIPERDHSVAHQIGARQGSLELSRKSIRNASARKTNLEEAISNDQPMNITNFFAGPDLLSVPIFEHFHGNPQAVERLLPVFHKRVLQEGQEMDHHKFCFVVWGIGDVFLSSVQIDVRVTGDVFNEALLFGTHLSTPCVMVARTAMVIFDCKGEEFHEALARAPSFKKYIDGLKTSHGYDVVENGVRDLRVAALKSCSCFEDNKIPLFVEQLAQVLDRQLFFPKELIPRKRRGEPRKSSRDLLIVNFGIINMKMATGFERMLQRHDSIGELALFNLPSDPYVAFAVTSVDVFVLHFEVFRKLSRENNFVEFIELFHGDGAKSKEFDTVEALRKTQFFANTSDDFLKYVATKLRTRLSVKDTLLDMQRDIALLQSGQISVGGTEIFESGHLIVKRTKGLPETELESNFEVRALTTCMLKVLSYNMLLHCVNRFPETREQMASAITKYSDLEFDLNLLANAPNMLRAALSSVLGALEPSESSEEFFEEIMLVAEERIFFPKELIVEKGELGSWGSPSMFILCAGHALVIGPNSSASKGEVMVVAAYTAPHAFGELVLLGITEERTATIQAKDFCFCLEIKRHALFPLLLKYPEAKKMFGTLAARYLVTSFSNCVDAAIIFSDIVVKFRTMVAMYSSHIVLFQETLCNQNDAGDALFIINGGHLIVSRNGERVCTLRPEQSFAAHLAFSGFSGEPSHLKDSRLRTHWGTATTEGVCSLIRISKTVVANALDRFPEYMPWAKKKADIEARRVLKFITQFEWRYQRHRLQQVLCTDASAEGKMKKQSLQTALQAWRIFTKSRRKHRARRVQQTLRLHQSLSQWLEQHRFSATRAAKEAAATAMRQGFTGPDKSTGNTHGMLESGWPKPKKSPFYELGLPRIWDKLPTYTHNIRCNDVLEVMHPAGAPPTAEPTTFLPTPTVLMRLAESNSGSPRTPSSPRSAKNTLGVSGRKEISRTVIRRTITTDFTPSCSAKEIGTGVADVICEREEHEEDDSPIEDQRLDSGHHRCSEDKRRTLIDYYRRVPPSSTDIGLSDTPREKGITGLDHFTMPRDKEVTGMDDGDSPEMERIPEIDGSVVPSRKEDRHYL
eukprot:GEMP01004699.1.p1 GENE.GEMP01004699.1~~GEMP01004699.1.p1  ORF type:complete len:1101 (+),score=229.06 GEMP01004699.1:127-3429(+)